MAFLSNVYLEKLREEWLYGASEKISGVAGPHVIIAPLGFKAKRVRFRFDFVAEVR